MVKQKLYKSIIKWVIAVAILILLIVSVPDKTEHCKKLTELTQIATTEALKTDSFIMNGIVKFAVDNPLSEELIKTYYAVNLKFFNFFVISIGTVNSKLVSIGILNYVFVLNDITNVFIKE
jgi:hypothetical protein